METSIEIQHSLEKKFVILNRILEITKELESDKYDDEAKFAEMLKKRGDEMKEADKLDLRVKELLSSMSPGLRNKIKGLISGKSNNVMTDNLLYTNIFEANKRNLMLLRRIIDIDNKFNEKFKKSQGVV